MKRIEYSNPAKLLYAAGFAVNYGHELDCANMYFIKNEIYDINVITRTVSKFCDIRSGFDKFTFNPRDDV